MRSGDTVQLFPLSQRRAEDEGGVLPVLRHVRLGYDDHVLGMPQSARSRGSMDCSVMDSTILRREAVSAIKRQAAHPGKRLREHIEAILAEGGNHGRSASEWVT